MARRPYNKTLIKSPFMLTPRNHTSRLSNAIDLNECYLALEPRQLLAVTVAYNSSTNILTITGDSSADSAYVINAAGGQVEVTGTGIAAQYFSAASLSRIDFFGYGGNDHFENQTSIANRAFGHAGDDFLSGGSGGDWFSGGPGSDEIRGNQGNDTLMGSEQNDLLYGGDGNDTLTGFTGDDTLYGGLGDDFLYGQAGNDFADGEAGDDRVRGNAGADTLYGGADNDYMMGDTENDQMYGGAGADELYAWLGDDLLEGGDGDDNLYAHNGNDTCRGGLGADLIRGGIGNDSIYGEADDDRLYGENGNDFIRGGTGVDLLRGGNDNDSLHGGDSGTGDTLYGDAGNDRFLRQGSDTVVDKAVEDAIIRFENATSTWTDREIEVIDEGLAMLVAQTANNALLRDSLDPQDLGFFKYAELEGAAAWNQLAVYEQQQWNYITGQWETTGYTYEREIHFADWDESSAWYNSQYSLVAVHELGHNWDSEEELATISANASQLWGNFLAISDWRDVNPNSPAGFEQSLDGNHWFANSASFAENYGQTNPREDFATIWEYFFNPDADPALAPSLQPKLSVLNNLFALLQG